MTTAPELHSPDRLHRRSGGKVIAGVCGGVADHLGVDVFRVRVVFVVLAALAGAGVAAYGMLWFFCPTGDDAQRPSPRERRQAQGLIVLGVIALLANGLVASSAPGSSLLALIVVLGGAALVWREVDVTGAAGGGLVTWLRLAAGATLVVGGLIVLVAAPDAALAGMNPTLLAVFGTLAGVVLLTVPLWMRMWRTLNAERAARIRNEEREEIASHLHDSVLQTLALIQKRSAQPDVVARLARRQERELRQWLFGEGAGRRESLASAVAAVAAEVEDAYGVEVETVTVGDVSPDEVRDEQIARGLQALIAAVREAIVNAVKHSEADRVDVYCEVDAERIEAFVRDRGIGFRLDDVADDRQGIAKSITARMERVGGAARIDSTPGRGTNVAVTLPRARTEQTVPETDHQEEQECSRDDVPRFPRRRSRGVSFGRAGRTRVRGRSGRGG